MAARVVVVEEQPKSAERRRREGWEESFRLMAERGDDLPLDGDVIGCTVWDEEEWEW